MSFNVWRLLLLIELVSALDDEQEVESDSDSADLGE
jgi:hypothetical protein